MTRYPTVLTVAADDTNGLSKQKIKVPAKISLTPAANPSDPYRLDGRPAYPDTPPFAVRANNRDEAFRIAHEFFETLRVDDHGSGVAKRAYDHAYCEWVNNMTNLSVASDAVDDAIQRFAEKRRGYTDEQVYRNISLKQPGWIVYMGALRWEDHR